MHYQYQRLSSKGESQSIYLGQLIVTPKVVAKKRDMKDNKSPGVDGIHPKLLLEIVEQIPSRLQQCSICH